MNAWSRVWLAAAAILIASTTVLDASKLGAQTPPQIGGPLSSQPSYSPDGREVAFETTWRGDQPDIWVVSTADGRIRPLAADQAVDEAEPAWSPDGSRIAFSSNRAGGGIWVIRRDGSDLVRLTSGPDSQPAWSPDGTQIAFVSNRGDRTRSIWIVNADGSGLRPVTKPPCCQNDPSFSLDGGQIVFSQSIYSGHRYIGNNLVIVNTDGTSLRQLTTGSFRDWNPSWGERGIIFDSDRIQPDRSRSIGIWMVQPDGSGLQAIPNARGGEPTWSRDGDKLAYVGFDSTIHEANLATATTRTLVRIKGYFIPISVMADVSPKVISLRNTPRIRVVIHSVPGIDFLQGIDQASLRFGRTGDERSLDSCTVAGEDLICHFRTALTGFRPGDTQGILRVSAFISGSGRMPLEGRDSIQVAP